MSRLTHPTIVTLEAQRGFKHKRMEVEKAAKKKEPSAPHTEKEEEGGPPLCLSFLYSLPFVCPFIHFSHSHRPSLFFLFFPAAQLHFFVSPFWFFNFFSLYFYLTIKRLSFLRLSTRRGKKKRRLHFVSYNTTRTSDAISIRLTRLCVGSPSVPRKKKKKKPFNMFAL